MENLSTPISFLGDRSLSLVATKIILLISALGILQTSVLWTILPRYVCKMILGSFINSMGYREGWLYMMNWQLFGRT
jgi:hypothetical protein